MDQTELTIKKDRSCRKVAEAIHEYLSKENPDIKYTLWRTEVENFGNIFAEDWSFHNACAEICRIDQEKKLWRKEKKSLVVHVSSQTQNHDSMEIISDKLNEEKLKILLKKSLGEDCFNISYSGFRYNYK